MALIYLPEGEPREIELALCRICLALEREMERELESKVPNFEGSNPVTVIKVKSLPRIRRQLKGKKLG